MEGMLGEAIKKIENSVSNFKKSKIEDYVLSRRTPELVMAFCGAAGSGVSTVANLLKERIEKSPYDYTVEIIKISEGIQKLKGNITIDVDLKWAEGFEPAGKRIAELQEWGNALREEYTTDVLSQYAICKILHLRSSKHLLPEEKELFEKKEIPKVQKRILWIIDSLKHPDEVDALRYVYGNMFFQVGVLCPHDKRFSRLKSKEMSEKEAALIIEKDKSEEVQFGQHLIETIHKADFFVNNFDDNTQSVESDLDRFVNLIFGGIETPTKHEYAMYVAQSSALSSGCLSRQVGSSITDEEGNVISYGCNDVPKPDGGLYCAEDSPDNRCFKTHDRACQNTKRKDIIIGKLERKLEQLLIEIKDLAKSKELDRFLEEDFVLHKFIDEAAKYSGIKQITEYTKAVHGEMDALIKLARKGGIGSKNCSMYVTTYPCHNCAKHIIASGIKKVFYIEPYEKSLAFELHSDAITLDQNSNSNKVKFIPFNGVSPRRYQDFFKIHGDRKTRGNLSAAAAKGKLPISEKFLDSYTEYEAKAIQALKGMHLYSIVLEIQEGADA
jgi:deoxycytidylate deaminase